MIITKGSSVVFVDSVGDEHQALVTNCFGLNGQVDWDDETRRGSACNVVWVSDSPNETDTYGAQIKRQTSVPGHNPLSAHGMYWKPVGV